MPNSCSLFLTVTAVAALASSCGDREPASREPPPAQPVVAASPQSAVEITGWPAGLGRAFVLRLGTSQDSYRLVVPEFGDRRFADSAVAIRVGDSIRVALVSRSGTVGDATLRISDFESGNGSCVTWPSAEIVAPTYARRAGAAAWRLALERDSVTSLVVDSLMGMHGADSLALMRDVAAASTGARSIADSLLLGIPFDVRRAYSFTSAGVSTVAGELIRRSSAEADPREERLFVVGERAARDVGAHGNVFSRSAAGRADSLPVTELVAALVSNRTSRTIVVLSVEDSRGLRLHILERISLRNWRLSWASAVSFC